MDENGNRKAQFFYSSGDMFDEHWRRPKKEWKPYEEYQREKKDIYRQQGGGFYQKEKFLIEKKPKLDSFFNRFMAASEKRHENTDVTLRNQQALIVNLETQVGELNKHFQEGFPVINNSGSISKAQVLATTTKYEEHKVPLVFLGTIKM